MTKDSGRKTSDGGSGIVPEALTEDNYESWKTCLKNYLVGHDLWAVVSGKFTEPDKHEEHRHDEWKKKNALALHAIQLSCGKGVYSKFHEKTHLSAEFVWNHLVERAWGPKPPTRKPSSHDDHQKAPVEDTAGIKEHLNYAQLYKAVLQGDWKATENVILGDPNAVRARVSSQEDTALHVAILAGHIEIAEKLVNSMEEGDLKLVNKHGATALSLAAICGERNLAKAMVRKNRDLLTIQENKHEDGHLPVIVAALYGQKNMVRYLYRHTPKHLLKPENDDENGVLLLNSLITAECFDVASMLLKKYPRLGVISDGHGIYPLRLLAHKPSAFRSGTKFTFWEQCIYYCVKVHSPWENHQFSYDENHEALGDDSMIEIDESDGENSDGKAHGGLNLPRIVPEIKYIHHRKLVHDEAEKLLICMFKEMQKLCKSELEDMGINSIIYDAIKHGIVEFIDEMLKYNPDVIWIKDKKGRTIFSHAIVLRQEKIFSRIYGLGTKKSIMARRHDVFKNNYLHLAAKLSPPSRLERVSGAALQMQRELQWFKEVESIVQPKLKEEVNESNKTPSALFTVEHKKLAKDGETWMKNTAGSSMIVGTLIAAVMFTTAFQVPGGNKNDSGLPTLLDSQPRPFLIFMFSNALSMFSSSTSLLMFLGILTARFSEQDFLKSLPTKLIFGLTCLFFSIVTMMASFGAALYLILHKQLSWITVPIIVLSTIPIALFSIVQFPLLIEMIYRTYGSGIFDKHKKYRYFGHSFNFFNTHTHT
ncbi:Ankyrin repeat family protein [Dorcoceras hygrometricum]|uniref:Ankyrin repeat family protein n=1 Tax=Dorcoceras hygrometricum TaxID=472368 RepID=A0A2Z7D4N6_9LAMI|nr:Ankyrin repeat family protein [Dorcoceras hygrometricum]